ncbi:MAG: BamA/TamA family outer membrane protein [Phycisphaeraceae bacterium]|nr:BamA/TamA family outer membrane protein [Phycisphaeraceae bacterium]
MSPACHALIRLNIPILFLLIVLVTMTTASAQAIDPEGRLVREVRVEGLDTTPKKLVENTVRTAVGQPYRQSTINEDIRRLTFLGRFDTVVAKVEDNGDGSIDVIFSVTEQARLLAMRFVGAKRLNAEQLLTLVLLKPGDPIDKSLIDRGARAIELAYAEKGHFAASVSYDKKALDEKRELIFRITEGPRVRVTELRYEGNQVYDDDRLASQVGQESYLWPFVAGYMDRTQLDIDVAAIRKYYQDRGYLNAQVGRRIDLSPRQNRAIVTFEVNEGKQHTVRDIQVRFTKDGAPFTDQLMSEDQIRMVLSLIKGGVYSDDRLADSQEAVRLWYGEIGFINTRVSINRTFDPNQPKVDVVVQIDEGTGPTMVDDIVIIGLTRTDQKVLLRRVRGLEPGRPVNLRGLEETRRLVRESTWFSNGTITALGNEDDLYRTFLIEAEEKNTGNFSIGAGLSSDSGVFGAISLEQRNFDIADWPESMDEFLAQRAFLGAGQTFNITLQPGNDISNYSIGFREPYLFETDYFFDISLSAFEAVREDFDEGRIGVRTGFGRRLGDVWTGSVRFRFEQVDISDIEPEAPVDVFAVAGESDLSALGLSLTRSTTDSNITPSRGSRLNLGLNQFGAVGGDYDFTRFSAGYSQFWTLDEDFLGRKTIVSLQFDTGYIPQDTSDVPLFERFYAGGRDFRGFAFRGVGPRGIRNDTMLLGDDPVGGRFQFISRLQYEVPVYSQFVRWAFFTDQGTIQDDFGFDQWRVSVGTGVRLRIPFFGQAPIAIDFGFPILEEEGDDTQILSFSIDLPFN